jgi:predicted porin
LIYYESPSFAGFQVLAAFSAANATSAVDATTNAKPRVGSIAGMYSNGPLNIAAGYEKHWNFGNGNIGAAAIPASVGSATLLATPTAANGGIVPVATFAAPVTAVAATAGSGFDDRAWTIGASYNFMGNLLVGIQYIDMRYELAAASEAKKKNWFLGADWNFAGPHHILGAYVNAGNTKGSATAHRWRHRA